MNHYLSLFALLILLSGCGSDRTTDAEAMGLDVGFETNEQPEPSTPKALVATSFIELPEGIGDCSCSLSLADKQEEGGTFFAFNRQSGSGYISLNGELIEVQRGASLSPADAAYESYFHENKNYKIQSSISHQEDSISYRGKVTVTVKDTKEKLSFEVMGSCSC